MNLFFVTADNRLLTPSLTGTLLPGVTRDSVLTLGKDLGLTPEERPVTVEEWETGVKRGDIREVFACGTAAVVTPVGEVKYAEKSFRIADGEPGKVTMTLRNALLAIQQGTSDDPHGWRHTLCP
jgi:branched-chain amino acid aminotransferase